MREELIALLEEAFEAGIITSTMQSQIDVIKKKMKLADAEYLLLEDEIRIDAYIHKVKEREKKGITFMGDLRKQYKITDDDRVIIQEKLKAEQKKTPVVSTQPSQKPNDTGKSDTTKKKEPSGSAEAGKQPDAPKKPEPSKKQETLKKQDSGTPGESDVMKRSELLKQHAQMSEPMREEAEVKKQEQQKKPEPPKSETRALPLVLVADDNETQLFLTKSVLEENNFACVTADTPEIAVRIITEKLPALVLCDVNFGIGKPTGFDVFTNIRTKKINVPFIIMSAFIQKEFKEHAKRIGITEYITKPTEPAQLLDVVKKYIRP